MEIKILDSATKNIYLVVFTEFFYVKISFLLNQIIIKIDTYLKMIK